MPTQSRAEVKEILISVTFESAAFIVAKGQKTPLMLEIEAEKTAQAAAARTTAGLPPSNKVTTYPNPDVADPALAEKLAGVLKYLAAGDVVALTKAKVDFKAWFTGVVDNKTGILVIEPIADQLFDQALAVDAPYTELRKLGMNRFGDPQGAETLGNWVKSIAFARCMPNGGLADDFVCLCKLLELDPDLIGGKLEFSEMDCAIMIDRKEIEENLHASGIRVRIGSTYSVPSRGKGGMRRFVPSNESITQAIEYIARQNRYHATREWMDQLPTWDKVDRFPELVRAVGGIQDVSKILDPIAKARVESLNALAISQFRKTFIGSVARTYKPGCQMDTMLLLKSTQGTKKSSLFKLLAPAGRFSATHVDLGDKDSMMVMIKNSWYECAELSGMTKKDLEIVKGHVTNRSDDLRLPYGKKITINPRWCILVGTTNDDTPIRDRTGSRRFWIVVVDDNVKIDLIFIESIVMQLWAQAKELYHASATCPACAACADGEVRCEEHRWWLGKEQDELRASYNLEFTEQEPYVDMVKQWLAGAITDAKTANSKQGYHPAKKNTEAMHMHEALKEIANLPEKDCADPFLQKRMAYALKTNGFIKKHTEYGNVWVPPGMQNRPDLKVVPNPAPKTDPNSNSGPTGTNGTP